MQMPKYRRNGRFLLSTRRAPASSGLVMSIAPAAAALPTTLRIHLRRAEFIACAVLGDPLPCVCPDCRKAAGTWAAERTIPEFVTQQLPPMFWTRQESRLSAQLAAPRRPARAWVLVPAACLALILLLFLTPARKAAPPRVEFETAYDAAARALDRPVLGDLEACGLLFTGMETLPEEESL